MDLILVGFNGVYWFPSVRYHPTNRSQHITSKKPLKKPLVSIKTPLIPLNPLDLLRWFLSLSQPDRDFKGLTYRVSKKG